MEVRIKDLPGGKTLMAALELHKWADYIMDENRQDPLWDEMLSRLNNVTVDLVHKAKTEVKEYSDISESLLLRLLYYWERDYEEIQEDTSSSD